MYVLCTNIDTIPLYDVNDDGPSWIEEIRLEKTFLYMNCMYSTAINTEEEVLNNMS